jgi:hypothetical protein
MIIEAPYSKLRGIFDPQGVPIYSNRSLTRSKLRGMRSLLDSTVWMFRISPCLRDSVVQEVFLGSPHQFRSGLFPL